MLRDDVFSLCGFTASPFKGARYRLKICILNRHIKDQALGVYIGVAMGTEQVLVLYNY